MGTCALPTFWAEIKEMSVIRMWNQSLSRDTEQSALTQLKDLGFKIDASDGSNL